MIGDEIDTFRNTTAAVSQNFRPNYKKTPRKSKKRQGPPTLSEPKTDTSTKVSCETFSLPR